MEQTIYVTKPYLPPMEEYIEEIRDMWDSHWITNMAKHHQEFTNRLKAYLGVQNLSLMVNGHTSLEVAIQAMHLSGEVITTPFTFISTTHAIVRNGLQPVFCDIREEDFTLDPARLESLITDQTVAILPVHVYGNLCDVEAIEEIANRHHLKVIYDAAHAFGETYKGRSICEYGDVSILSFHATKVFHSIEGGAVIWKDEELGKEIKQLRNFGIQDEELVKAVGTNAKMNEFSAAMGICNLRHIDEEIKKRGDIAKRYLQNLSELSDIQLPNFSVYDRPNFAYFPIRLAMGQMRDGLYNYLKEKNIYTRKYFYPLTSRTACYRDVFWNAQTPVAEKVSGEILTLPIYADLNLEAVDTICEEIRKFMRGKAI